MKVFQNESTQVLVLTLAALAVGIVVLPLAVALVAKGLLLIFTSPVAVLKGMGLFTLGYLTKKFVK